MGLSFRKSITAGPFRFNLSGAGIGVSVGVPGFRVGTGPRGNYVSMSAGGFTYRTSLGTSGGRASQAPAARPPEVISEPAPRRPGEQFIPSGSATVAPLQLIESADIRMLSDSDSASLVEEINSKRAKFSVWYTPLLIVGLLWWYKWTLPFEPATAVTVALVIISITAATGSFWLYMWDEARQSTVLFYDFDEQGEHMYAQVVHAFTDMSNSRGSWHILASGKVLDGRYNAGAGKTIQRKDAQFGNGGLKHVKCNIDVPYMNAGPNTFYFYPDRIYLASRSHVAVCKYGALDMSTRLTRFIEDDAVPADARVIDHTWRFVNRNGTPDRRFKNNRQLPVAEYEELQLSSAQGIREMFQVSNAGTAESFVNSLRDWMRYESAKGTTRRA